MKRIGSTVFGLLIALCLALSASPQALLAANPNVGYADFSFGSTIGNDPTASKPQSKLWYNDGFWWAVLFNTGSGTYHIYKLNWPSQWADTGVVVDDRPLSRADCLWDGAHLYVASTKSNLNGADSANQGRLYRYSYANGSYTLDPGYPAVMFTGSVETTAIDKDTTGQIWVTFTKGSKVYVNRSLKDANGVANDASWGTPFVVPGPSTATSLNSDDISSLVAYRDQNGSSIGVLWSNHKTPSSMYFSYHKDGNPDLTWQPIETIYTATCAADDHINLKSLQADASGAIYAAVKTSFGDAGCGGTSSSPLLRLVVRRPNNSWAVATFGTVGDDHTRPVVLLDTSNRRVYMFATAPTSCGIIYMKSTSMDNLSFPTGKGTPFISSSTYTCLNNATSTKQTVNSTTGLVVLASDMNKSFYAHNVLSLGGTPPGDTTPPTVTSRAPADSATGVATSASVSATFSEPVAGVGSGTFTLTPANGAPIPATVTYNSANTTATLAPSAPLAANTTYTASLLAGIADTAGNPLAPISWSFTTADAPPTGTSVSFAPVADTYVSQAAPTSSFGSSSTFAVVDGASSAKQGFIRFTVSGLPAGAAIASAKLRLYVTNDSTSGGVVRRVADNSWLETISWNTKPAIDSAAIATLGAVALNTTIEIDLGGAITGNGTYSFAITPQAGNTNTVGYAARENSTTSTRPQLVVTTN